jgi:hypothetical protein
MRAGAVLAGEDAVLQGQVDAGRVDQVDDRHAIAHGDFLGAEDLGMVSGHQAPAFTVASLATTTAGRPSMRPTPVTTPAPGACPS